MRASSTSIIPFTELKDIVTNSDYKSRILELYHVELLSIKYFMLKLGLSHYLGLIKLWQILFLRGKIMANILRCLNLDKHEKEIHEMVHVCANINKNEKNVACLVSEMNSTAIACNMCVRGS